MRQLRKIWAEDFSACELGRDRLFVFLLKLVTSIEYLCGGERWEYAQKQNAELKQRPRTEAQ